MRPLCLCGLALFLFLGCKSQDGTCLYTIGTPYFPGGPGSETLVAKVILPDGTEHSTSAAAAVATSVDGGTRGKLVPLEGSISGRVADSKPGELVVDACEPGASCEPTLYRLMVTAPGLALGLPLGRSVTATWSFRVGGWEWSQKIAVFDGNSPSSGDGTRALWLWAADPSQGGEVAGLFKVETQQLFCGGTRTGTHPCNGGAPAPDDYAFHFSALGNGSHITLATGQSGNLLVSTSTGQQQHLTVHDLRSYQSEKCDDYANWAWWAAGHAGPNGDPE